MASPPRRRSTRRRAVAEINVVPYIDVMLVLLIIFMVTAPMLAPSVIQLPSVGQASHAPDTLIEVGVRADKSMTLQWRDAKGKSGASQQGVALPKLSDAVAQLARDHGATLASTSVMIAADKDVKYDEVIQVLNRLKQGGVQRVGLAVQASGS